MIVERRRTGAMRRWEFLRRRGDWFRTSARSCGDPLLRSYRHPLLGNMTHPRPRPRPLRNRNGLTTPFPSLSFARIYDPSSPLLTNDIHSRNDSPTRPLKPVVDHQAKEWSKTRSTRSNQPNRLARKVCSPSTSSPLRPDRSGQDF